VVIRGERGVGKSTLLARLQGKPYVADYVETPAIDVGTVLWSYKGALACLLTPSTL
jgi:GTPase SAR1 family protein